ncbi:unnamed protein product [Rhizoctonia solani]|uniref:Mid2 domain-containing protein n=1 Tax=Rhizoctonia solani TaxID=456999 RepID=A0A8H2XCP3_9AGAM|nr:unnamed protein product [Rhizoctonia solani]
MSTSHGSLSTHNSTAESTVRSRTRTRTRTAASTLTKTVSRTLSASISESVGVAPISSQPAPASTGDPKPTRHSAAQLTTGLAVGIGFLVLAILSILFLFYLRRRRIGRRQPPPSGHTRFHSLQEPSPNEKRLSTNIRYSGYSTVSTPLSTVDEEREDELSVSQSQAKRQWSRTIQSMVGRFAWYSRTSDGRTGVRDERSERQARPRPPPVSRVRLGRVPRR